MNAEPTLEQLARKAEQLRQTSQPAGGAVTATTDEKPVSRNCAECGGAYLWTPLVMNGKEIAIKRLCDDCIEKGRKREARLEELQKNHIYKLEGQERDDAIRQAILEMGGNPWEHGHAALDNFDPADSPKALGAAREFAAAVKAAGKFDPVRGLYLWGETGPGKTHLAIGVVRWLLEEGYKPQGIVFDHAAGLIARIQDTYGRKDERTMGVLEKRINAKLWVLDDFGTERPSDDVIRHMTVIFAERAMKPSLVTSNYSPERLDRERPDMMRVLSRLGPKYFRTVEVKGRDRRFD